MRIAYISYEHPLGIAGGGIGTYTAQIALIMSGRKHAVEVFSAVLGGSYKCMPTNNYKLHLIPVTSHQDFREQVEKIFASIHQTEPFDLVENAEYGADALLIKKRYPGLPLVVKLHTPRFLVDRLNFVSPRLFSKLRYILGGFLKGKFPKPYWKIKYGFDPEQELYQLADAVSSPSTSLAEIVKSEWGRKEITVLPNPLPSTTMVTVNRQNPDNAIRVLFIGRLERRKGIYDIAKAIPLIFKKKTSIKFCFAGSDQPSIRPGISTKAYLLKRLAPYLDRLEFSGLLKPAELNSRLTETDICIFPSLWENFPNVCMEAMLAGKAVIASKNGGMSEMITHLKNGYLISPNSPNELADAILKLSGDNELRQILSAAGREHVLETYDPSIIGQKTELFYQYTLNKKK